jgi:hypothetical protein
MITVEAIKKAIAGLPEGEKVALAAWLHLQTLGDWDKDMERDFAQGGREYRLVEKIGAEIRSGKFRPMSEGKPGGKSRGNE